MKCFKFVLLVMIFTACVVSSTAQSKLEEGIEFYRSGDFASAAARLREATNDKSVDKIAWSYLGAALLKSDNSKDAVSAFLKAPVRRSLGSGNDKQSSIVNRRRPSYTNMARMNGTSGVVQLAIEFRSDNKIGFVSVFRSLPDGLTEEAITAAQAIKFRPAVSNGMPVTTVEILEYSFSSGY